MRRRFFAIMVLVSLLFSCLGVKGAEPQIPKDLTDLTKNIASPVTAEQAIVIIMTALNKQPGKPVDTIKGQKPSSWASSYISAADTNGWLPDKIPVLTSAAAKDFVTGFFQSCLGYKVFKTATSPEEQDALNAAIEAMAEKTSIIAVGDTKALQATATKEDIGKLLSAYRKKSVGWFTKTAAWSLYSANKLGMAETVFKICAEAGSNPGAMDADLADAYYGLGAILSHHIIKNYTAATENLNKAIKISPNSKVAVNAANLLKNMPPVELGYDYMPDKPVTYEELLSVYANSLDLNVNSTPGDFKVVDLKGQSPSDWAKKFVNFIYSRDYAPSIPTSFKDPVPRYWAASFAARIKYYDTYDYDKYFPFNDLSNISADDRMFINIAVDRNLFPLPTGNTFDPNGKVLYKELKPLIDSSKNPGEPHRQEYTKTSYKKIVDTYYVDNGLNHFTAQNSIINKRADQLDIVNFAQAYYYMDDPQHMNVFKAAQYKPEGTKYIRTRFDLTNEIRDGLAAAQAKKLKTMLELDIWGDSAYNIIKDPAKRLGVVSDLVHLTELYDMDGVHLDFEKLPKEARESYSLFLKELSKALKVKKKLLTCVVGAYYTDKTEAKTAYDLSVIGKECDYVKVILYDDFPAKGYPQSGKDGPISRLDWNEKVLKYMVQKVPSRKILLGLGAYGIDFDITNKKDAQFLNLSDIKAVTDNAKAGTVKYLYDDKTQAPYIEFTDSKGDAHRLWYENEKSLGLRMDQVHKYELGGIFYFWVGSDSQDLFNAISKNLR